MAALRLAADKKETELPFQIYDCRDQYELDLYDLADSIIVADSNNEDVEVPLSKVKLPLYEL